MLKTRVPFIALFWIAVGGCAFEPNASGALRLKVQTETTATAIVFNATLINRSNGSLYVDLGTIPGQVRPIVDQIVVRDNQDRVVWRLVASNEAVAGVSWGTQVNSGGSVEFAPAVWSLVDSLGNAVMNGKYRAEVTKTAFTTAADGAMSQVALRVTSEEFEVRR